MNGLEVAVLGEVADVIDPPAADPTDVGTFAELASLATVAVDGKFAGSESEVALMAAPRFNSFASGLYQTAGDASSLLRLKESLGTYLVTAHMANSYGQAGADSFTKDDNSDLYADALSVGMRGRDAITCAMWPAISLGVDQFSRHGAATVLFSQALYSVHVENAATTRRGAVLRTRVKTA